MALVTAGRLAVKVSRRFAVAKHQLKTQVITFAFGPRVAACQAPWTGEEVTYLADCAAQSAGGWKTVLRRFSSLFPRLSLSRARRRAGAGQRRVHAPQSLGQSPVGIFGSPRELYGRRHSSSVCVYTRLTAVKTYINAWEGGGACKFQNMRVRISQLSVCVY